MTHLAVEKWFTDRFSRHFPPMWRSCPTVYSEMNYFTIGQILVMLWIRPSRPQGVQPLPNEAVGKLRVIRVGDRLLHGA